MSGSSIRFRLISGLERTLTQHATALQAQLQQLDTQVGILTEQYAHITKDYKTLAASLAQT